jgi:hypothetical protein
MTLHSHIFLMLVRAIVSGGQIERRACLAPYRFPFQKDELARRGIGRSVGLLAMRRD